MYYRINVGCGMTPTDGWINYDNSISVRLSSYPSLVKILHKIKLISTAQLEYILFCRNSNIIQADVTKQIPNPDQSVEVIYSSHMFEHLDRKEVAMFLQEAKRVLIPGGILRLAIPDLKKLVKNYLEKGDADMFIESTNLCRPRPRKLSDRLRILLVGTRQHQWLYDSTSLSNLLIRFGFENIQILTIGNTTIVNPSPLNLFEDAGESMFLEAQLPR